MNIFDSVCVILIIASVIVCTVKGYKKVVFKAAAFAIAMFAAKLTGSVFGNFLLSDVIKVKINLISDSVSDAIVTGIGTALMFVFLFILLRLIFKIVEGKMEKSLQSIVLDRLCGALAGLFIGVAVAFAFTEIVSIVLVVVSSLTRSHDIFDFVDNSVIFKLFRNLN